MAEAEEVKTETVTVTLTEDTLAGLRLIAEHKGITVEEVGASPPPPRKPRTQRRARTRSAKRSRS